VQTTFKHRLGPISAVFLLLVVLWMVVVIVQAKTMINKKKRE
jgi:hypothetical protein